MNLWRPMFRVPLPLALPDPANPRLAAAVNEYALALRTFYDERANWHRRLYRVSGVVVIMVGAALPVLAALDYPGKELIISLAGAAVAVLTALRAFYRWDRAWILLRTTEMALTAAYWQWRTQIEDETATDSVRNTATMLFLATLTELRQREADSFFKDLAFPSHQQPPDHQATAR